MRACHCSVESAKLIAICAVLTVGYARADNVVCTAEGNDTDTCDIALPNVLAQETTYPMVPLHAGETVEVSASGCVQTGGSGSTWKRYLKPSGNNSDHLYSGTIHFPGAATAARFQDLIGQTTTITADGPLTLGYQDDDYTDNGYWSHDNGNDDQCADQSGPMRGRAVAHLRIHRTNATANPPGTVYGQCVPKGALEEFCVIDRPDVTRAVEVFPSVRFCDGDRVLVTATGCAQTGGSGDTWKDYVHPQGDNSSKEYFGQLALPGFMGGALQPISTFTTGNPFTASAGVLSLGYTDDDYDDNGYWSHDNGNNNQCGSQNPGNAHVEITITHSREKIGACGLISQVTTESGATAGFAQSETSATVAKSPSGSHRLLVTFNDQSGNIDRIVFSPTDPPGRQVFSGATLMGWALSDDEGAHWTYGGKENPTPGTSVLWGDPAIAAQPDGTTVFLSNLAIPTTEFTPGELVRSTGGACIFKSTDGGSTFSFHQCLAHKSSTAPNGDFYDGASLVVAPDGAVYAAYHDITTGLIDVWKAPDVNSQFTPIASPFGGIGSLSHPRLRAAGDGTLYVMTVLPGTAANPSKGPAPFAFASRFSNGKWGTPVPVSEQFVSADVIDLNTQVLGKELTIRFGPEFGFDVGPASVDGKDALRFVITRNDAQGKLFVEGSACAADLTSCHPVPEWHFGPIADDGSLAQAFGPSVAAFDRTAAAGNPAAAWAATFYVVRGAATTSVRTARMYLNYVDGVPTPDIFEVPDPLTVCSDARSNGLWGYWGDYNSVVPVTWTNQMPAFVSFVSFDSDLGCDRRWPYLGTRQHVAAVRWPQ
jgi:hypothetical protein